MPRKLRAVTRKTEEVSQSLVPVTLDDLMATAERPKNPKGGRPRRDELLVLQERLDKEGEYILANTASRVLTNVKSELPLTCDDSCGYRRSCPLFRPHEGIDERPCSIGPHPAYGMQCPVEAELALISFYGLLKELDIKLDKPSEVMAIAELAGIQVWKRRCQIRFNEDDIMMEESTGVDKQGNLGVKNVEHPLWNTFRYLQKRESELKKEFMNTRQEQAKNRNAAGQTDLSSLLSTINERKKGQ